LSAEVQRVRASTPKREPFEAPTPAQQVTSLLQRLREW
jgi:hypothetical protein